MKLQIRKLRNTVSSKLSKHTIGMYLHMYTNDYTYVRMYVCTILYRICKYRPLRPKAANKKDAWNNWIGAF